MESTQVKLITKECPNCGGRLNVPVESHEPVDCPRCDQTVIPVSTIAQRAFEKKVEGISPTISQQNLDKISTVSAAESFFEGFIATYEWDEFVYKYDLLTIPELDAILNNLKITSSHDPNVWKLDVQAWIIPLKKKVEHLHLLAELLVKVYETDETEAYRIYDAYRSTNNYLVNSKDYILDKIEKRINEYKKHAPKIAPSLDSQLEEIKSILDNLTLIEKMVDIPEFKKSSEAKNKAISHRLKEDGLDAEEIYLSAKEFLATKKINEALTKLNLIRGYKDADKLFENANRIVIAENYFEIGGNAYLVKPDYIYDLDDLTRHDKNRATQIRTTDNELLVDDLNYLIGHFGTRIFYFDTKFAIQVYDFSSGEKRSIDPGKKYYFGKKNNKYWFSNDGLKVYFLEELTNTKITHSESKDKVNNKNNFAFVCLNLASSAEAKQTIIPELVDIHAFSNNVAFYEYYDVTLEEEQVKRKVHKHIVQNGHFVARNIVTGALSRPVPKDVAIMRIYNDKFIYLRYNKTIYNMSLCIKDIFTKDAIETVIDPNVYDFEFITNGAIYYTIGNKVNRSLYRYNLEEEKVEEVITRFKTEDYTVIGDYLYYFTGDAYNYTLKKYGLNTGKTIILASNIKRSFKITDGYFYYEDDYHRLCSIRIDGTDFHMLAENVTDFIGVHNNRVYYVREEYAGKEVTTDTKFDKDKGKVVVEQKHDKIGYSLYACTAKGTEVKKIAFDTYNVMAKEKDMENLLIVYRENKSFRCITPGQDNSPFSRVIYAFTNLNLTTGEEEVKFTTNYPGGTTMMSEKRGCFLFKKKQKEVKLEYEELDNHEKYTKTDLVEAGFICGRDTSSFVPNSKAN